jgi:hypothetical protein
VQQVRGQQSNPEFEEDGNRGVLDRGDDRIAVLVVLPKPLVVFQTDKAAVRNTRDVVEAQFQRLQQRVGDQPEQQEHQRRDKDVGDLPVFPEEPARLFPEAASRSR